DPASTDTLHNYITGAPGVYTINIIAVSPDLPNATQPFITIQKSFLVVAAGGTNNVVTPNVPPQVITAFHVDNSTGVPENVLSQVTFSEPVTNIPGNVTLSDSSGNVSLFLLGVKSDGTVANPVQPGDFITSLTVQAPGGLRFGTPYILTLNGNIVDQNSPPLSLSPFTLHFTTFTPEQLDHNQNTTGGVTRLVPIGRRAYSGKLVNAA